MRARLLAVAILAVLAIPTVLARPADAPVLTVGDFWDVENSIPLPTGASQVSRANTTVVDFETITVNGTSYDATRTASRSTQTMSIGGFTTITVTNSTTWARRSDGATLRVVTNTTILTNVAGFPPATTASETVYEQPCRMHDWPIDVAKSWTTRCTSTTTTTSGAQPPQTTNATTDYTIRVLREEAVSVPAGNFTALVLQTNTSSSGSNSSSYSWFAPAACGPVKTALDAAGGNATSRLLSFACAKAPANVPPTTTPGTTPATGPATTTPPAGGSGIPGPAAALVVAAMAAAAALARKRS